MNIVFFIQNMSRAGGSERVCSIIANYLDQQGYNITILSICGKAPSFFQLNNGIRQKTLIYADVIDNKKQFIQVLRLLNKYYKDNETDLVIDVFPALSIYTLLLKRKYRFNNISWEHFNYLNNSGMNRIGRQAALRFSDLIVTLTNTDKELYIKNNPNTENKLISIFNPTPYPDLKTQDRKDHSVVAIGRLERQKGFHHLLSIWSEVEKKDGDSHLYIIGEGEEREELEKQIKQKGLKRVVLTGRQTNVDYYYRKASVVVSTSEQEGLPMVMIEAQSFGVPIVSFDYMTGPRDIITDGKDGYVINGRSQEEKNKKMATAILELLSDDRKQQEMGKEAKRSSERFQIDNIGNEWKQIIEEINRK